MKNRAVFCVVAAALAAGVWTTAVRAAAARPKLVVAIIVDQFRYDYLTRFRGDYHAGFERLLTRGAVFTNAGYIHAKTVTAVGHSTYLSGATPSVSGIVDNSWWDRTLGRTVQAVSDGSVKTVGRPPAAVGASGARGASGNPLPALSASPRQLLVSTVGDELKMRYPGSHVVGVSIKDRGAILPAGHMADGAYWFADDVKRWITSSYYRDQLPPWVTDLNADIAKRNLYGEWYPVDTKPGSGKPFCTSKPPVPAAPGAAAPEGEQTCRNIESTPVGNELIEEFAEKEIAADNLGAHESTDILTVSFSSNDYVGHAVGPDSPEVHDISIRTDRLLGKFMDYVDGRVGAGNVVYVLSADHGVSPVPEVNQKRGMPGGRIAAKTLTDAATAALTQKFGEGKWFVSGYDFLNWDLIESRHLSHAQVERVAADALTKVPHVARVYTRTELQSGAVTGDHVGHGFTVGFFPGRSGDLFVLLEPYWMTSTIGTTHGTPYWYDQHVPVIFMGPGIKAGTYAESVNVNDVAPTLAAMLGVETPSGAAGRVLREMLEEVPPTPAPVVGKPGRGAGKK